MENSKNDSTSNLFIPSSILIFKYVIICFVFYLRGIMGYLLLNVTILFIKIFCWFRSFFKENVVIFYIRKDYSATKPYFLFSLTVSWPRAKR